MKRNRMMRIASFLLIAVLATTCAISGTFAKYTSDFSGASTARVAKWAFTVNSTDMTSAVQTFDFDLFESVNDTAVKETTDDTPIIAPGTTGSFEITVINKSEVAATYKLSLSETNTASIPIKYSTDGTNWKTLTEFNDAQSATAIAMTNGQAEITVYWQWAFYVNADGDTTDTNLGWKGTDTVTTTATIHVEQVDTVTLS